MQTATVHIAERVGGDDPFPGVRVAVVIPCYRVAGQVERVIAGIPAWVEAVIAVEDDSPDDTLAVLRRVDDPRLVVVEHPENRGVCAAMASGFAEARRRGIDVVVKMDGDDQMDPRHLPDLVRPLVEGRADVAKGNRYAHIDALRAMPPLRILGNAGLTFLVKAASGYWNIFDPANGFIAVRTEVLEHFRRRLPRRYFFESGFLIELGIARAVVLDVPIPARYGDERSSLSITRTLIGFPPRLLHGLLRRIAWRYFVHEFSAVSVFLLLGLPCLALGAAFGLWLWWHGVQQGEYAHVGPVMLAAMPILIGFQLVLQAIVLDVGNVPRAPISSRLEGGAA
jgi:glycosyltransferase involved in cell wall biosynthesis